MKCGVRYCRHDAVERGFCERHAADHRAPVDLDALSFEQLADYHKSMCAMRDMLWAQWGQTANECNRVHDFACDKYIRRAEPTEQPTPEQARKDGAG